MTDIVTTTINIAPIFQFVQVALMQLGLFTLIGIIVFLIHNHKNVKTLTDKYPLVSLEFMQKGLRSQNVENNQEIHEVNLRLEDIEKQIDQIKDMCKGEVHVD